MAIFASSSWVNFTFLNCQIKLNVSERWHNVLFRKNWKLFFCYRIYCFVPFWYSSPIKTKHEIVTDALILMPVCRILSCNLWSVVDLHVHSSPALSIIIWSHYYSCFFLLFSPGSWIERKQASPISALKNVFFSPNIHLRVNLLNYVILQHSAKSLEFQMAGFVFMC